MYKSIQPPIQCILSYVSTMHLIQLTLKGTFNVTNIIYFIKEYLSEDSNLSVSESDGNIKLDTLHPAPVYLASA